VCPNNYDTVELISLVQGCIQVHLTDFADVLKVTLIRASRRRNKVIMLGKTDQTDQTEKFDSRLIRMDSRSS